MRYAHSTFPWLLALTLCAVSACDDWFRVPACTYSATHERCETAMGDAMVTNGADLSAMQGPIGAMMASPVSFRPVAMPASVSANKWIGVNSFDTILFHNKNQNPQFTVYNLKQANVPSGYALMVNSDFSRPANIGNTSSISNVLTSNSTIFALKTDSVHTVNRDGSLAEILSLNVNQGEALINSFRSFASPSADLVVMQIKNGLYSDFTMMSYYASQKWNSIRFPPGVLATYATYHAVGNLDNQGIGIVGNEVLIFKDSKLSGAYHLISAADSALIPAFDPELTNEINGKIKEANGGMEGGSPIRSAFIADLNNDGYAELIYARHQQVFVASYDHKKPVNSRLINWPGALLNIASRPDAGNPDRTEAMSVVDLNGDQYPDLIIETSSPENVYFYINNGKQP